MIQFLAIPEYGLLEIKSPNARRKHLESRFDQICNKIFEAEKHGTFGVLARFGPWNQMVQQFCELWKLLY